MNHNDGKMEASARLTPWSPFRELEDMKRRLDEIFGHSMPPSVWRRLPAKQMTWAPKIDVFEKGDKLVVRYSA